MRQGRIFIGESLYTGRFRSSIYTRNKSKSLQIHVICSVKASISYNLKLLSASIRASLYTGKNQEQYIEKI